MWFSSQVIDIFTQTHFGDTAKFFLSSNSKLEWYQHFIILLALFFHIVENISLRSPKIQLKNFKTTRNTYFSISKIANRCLFWKSGGGWDIYVIARVFILDFQGNTMISVPWKSGGRCMGMWWLMVHMTHACRWQILVCHRHSWAYRHVWNVWANPSYFISLTSYYVTVLIYVIEYISYSLSIIHGAVQYFSLLGTCHESYGHILELMSFKSWHGILRKGGVTDLSRLIWVVVRKHIIFSTCIFCNIILQDRDKNIKKVSNFNTSIPVTVSGQWPLHWFYLG